MLLAKEKGVCTCLQWCSCPILALRTVIFSVCRLLKQTNADLNGLMFWGFMLHENVRACLVESDNYVGGQKLKFVVPTFDS